MRYASFIGTMASNLRPVVLLLTASVLLAGCTSGPNQQAAGAAGARRASSIATNFPKATDSPVLPANSAK